MFDQLEALGAPLPGLAAYRERMAAVAQPFVTPGIIAPPPPYGSMTAEEIRQTLREQAIDSLIEKAQNSWGTTSFGGHQTTARAAIDAAYAEETRQDADAIVAAIAVEFDRHAAEARWLAEKGIRPEDDEASLFHASEELRTRWLAFKTEGAPALERLLRLRWNLNRWWNLPPDPAEARKLGHPFDELAAQSVLVTKPDSRAVLPDEPFFPHRRWLAIANSLAMPLPSEIDPNRLAEVEGLPVAALLAEAEARAADHGYADDGTNDYRIIEQKEN